MNIRAKILTFAVLSALTLPLTGFAQSHSQMFDALGYNTYWNGSAWVSYAAGYGHVVSPSGAGDWTLYTTGNAASAGLTRTLTPVMAVTAAGTVSATAFSGNGSGLTGVTASVSSGASGSLVYRDQNGNLVASSGLSISSTTGSVGIGTTAPASILEISSGTPLLTINGGTSAAFRGIQYQYGGLNFAWDRANSSTGEFRREIGPGAVWGGFQTFYTDTSERMRIVSSGLVGIGTTAPNAALDVNGTVSATNVKAAGTVQLGAYSSAPVVCAAGYKGMVAMSNALSDLCLCTGTAWVRVGSGGTACSW